MLRLLHYIDTSAALRRSPQTFSCEILKTVVVGRGRFEGPACGRWGVGRGCVSVMGRFRGQGCSWSSG